MLFNVFLFSFAPFCVQCFLTTFCKRYFKNKPYFLTYLATVVRSQITHRCRQNMQTPPRIQNQNLLVSNTGNNHTTVQYITVIQTI